ncbi:DNA recombination protein RmuC [Natronospirillum operosum]|uniref:DNA recombination protein RmuC n=1 Tax=Natronospirillum operosum TaxID=2759953 RepID=A0A4Z0WI22_9GAMM|nr:DNA recombination protein RmuC [Natronospirillum operosum]TGG95281.1 DNA recombination protein RmuC [Natronospirillum operosum]
MSVLENLLANPPLLFTIAGLLVAALAASVAFNVRQRSWLQQRDDELAESQEARQQQEVMLGRQEETIQGLREQLQGSEQALTQARQEAQREYQTRLEAEQKLALERQRLQSERQQWEEKQRVLEDSEERLQKNFENLANRIFDQKQQHFSRTSQESLQNLMQPMREQLKDFRQRVETVYEKDTEDRQSLRFQLNELKKMNETMNEEARRLTNALKGEKKTQGNWGEMLLERILEESGLRKGHEYDVQFSARGESGQRLQPDAIIHLPDEKDIIVDAKVSLVDFERYVNAEDELDRAASLKAHVDAVRTQMKNLSAKNYEQIDSLRTLDFVLMFVPVEAAFLVAVEQDPMLFRDAFDRNIILVSPSTLLAVLKTIHNIWRNEHQNRNAVQIAEEAGKLYDQFVLFTESLKDVQKHLGKSQDSLDKSIKQLSEGRGNAVRRVEKLRELGAKNKKQLSVDDLS